MCARCLKSVILGLAVALVAMMPISLVAQVEESATGAIEARSRWNVFVGYSYLSPHGTVNTPLLHGVVLPVNFVDVSTGGILSVARYFNRSIGLEMVLDTHLENEGQTSPTGAWVVPRDDFSGGGLGLIARFPSGRITPFVHALGGADYVGGPHWNANRTDKLGPMVTAGGGLDLKLSHHISIRLFQADYQYVYVNWGTGYQGGIGEPNIARLSAGVVIQ